MGLSGSDGTRGATMTDRKYFGHQGTPILVGLSLGALLGSASGFLAVDVHIWASWGCSTAFTRMTSPKRIRCGGRYLLWLGRFGAVVSAQGSGCG